MFHNNGEVCRKSTDSINAGQRKVWEQLTINWKQSLCGPLQCPTDRHRKGLPTGGRSPEEHYIDAETNINIQVTRTAICVATDISPRNNYLEECETNLSFASKNTLQCNHRIADYFTMWGCLRRILGRKGKELIDGWKPCIMKSSIIHTLHQIFYWADHTK